MKPRLFESEVYGWPSMPELEGQLCLLERDLSF